ncbi:MobF family relaxase [Streptomyces sp. RFCAC02]|uniref:MobF family relaxase n=1 Tax=Streptomyces sp. RFCAC02 TaxID=2499143 RepID=UPI0010228D16|nr:MobF family relaxase [Streptomyces sp. RFCAC02]
MMTIHKLSAGNGYLYYTREIASGDERRTGRRGLTDYYTAEGNPPGVWVGSGTVELGVSGTVTEAQMKALYGEGLHPEADRIIEGALQEGQTEKAAIRRARLGRRYYQYDQDQGPLAAQIQTAIEEFEDHHGRAATDKERRRLRGRAGARAFREDFGRAPKDGEELSRYITANTTSGRQAVAGYDLVFRNKYGSLLWALGDEETCRQVQKAHEQAITDTLDWIERHALATRTGVNGIAQEDVRGGLIAARYRHYDSRRGDPLLHDHVVVANKVRGLDGKWRSIDGRLLYAMGVAASELYNQRVVEELCGRLGLRAQEREVTPGKRPVMAISGLDDDLVDAFSKRAQDIHAELRQLLAEYRRRYGREPDGTTRIALIQQAAQRTRPGKKKARALADLRASWRSEAIAMFGAERIDGLLRRARQTAASSGAPVTMDVAEAAREVLRVVSEERSVWGERHVLAEARRYVVRATGGRGDTRGLAERITGTVLEQGALQITPPELHAPFAPLLRADGSSIYRRRESRLYTSHAVLANEQRLLDAARACVIPALSVDRFATVAERFGGEQLDAGQLRLAEACACSERLLVVGIGPAGSGKTTALRLVREAVVAGGGRLIGLAPSSRAAKVMESELDTTAYTLHSWLVQRERAADGRRIREEFQLRAGDVIVVDEAGMAGTRNLARVVEEAEAAGALVRLIGDPAQLGAVESGGALRLVAREVGAVELETLHRFRTPGEAAATLLLRDGNPADAWRWHLTAGRIVGGDTDTMLNSVFTAWQSDTAAGRHPLMMAEDADSVRELNLRAQAHQLATGRIDLGRSIALRDETRAGVGDVIVTRRNERRLSVLHGRDFVKNGDQWHIESLDEDGNAVARHTDHGGRVVLPAGYLQQHAELGYASSVHRAQGVTVDTAHGLITARTSREAAYVMATRGRHANHLHVVTEEGQSMRDVLDTVVHSSRASASAHGTIRAEQERAGSIAQLVAEYADVHGRADSLRLERTARRVLGAAAERFISSDAWSAVERALRAAEAEGWDAGRLLADCHDACGFSDADEPAAVLSWRINTQAAEGRAAVRRAAEQEARPGGSRPLKHVDQDCLGRLLAQAERLRRHALDELGRADAAVANQPRPVIVDSLPVPPWPHRPCGSLTRAQLAAALTDTRLLMRRAARDGAPEVERRAAAEHAGLRRELRLRRAMRPIHRMREDWQRESGIDSSGTAQQPLGTIRSQLTGTLHRQDAARERLRRADIIADRVRAEQRLRRRLPHGPPPTPDQSGPLPEWLAPSAALQRADVPPAWRQHLEERRSVLTQRLAQVGALLATHPPGWTRPLGPVPPTGGELRQLWEHTAALTEAWRAQHGLGDSVNGIGPPPEEQREAHAWTELKRRIDTVGRRSRATAAAHARPDDPTLGTRIAARAAENHLYRMLATDFPDPGDREAATAATTASADLALHLILNGDEPPETWMREIPAPDPADETQQAQWRQLVTAIALWRLTRTTASDTPLGDIPDDDELRARWARLHDALMLFQRSRIRQLLCNTHTLVPATGRANRSPEADEGDRRDQRPPATTPIPRSRPRSR